MCFELFKNSMRATVETFGDEALPPISVTIMAGKEDLTVKVWAALLRILRKGLASATRFGLACTLSVLFERPFYAQCTVVNAHLTFNNPVHFARQKSQPALHFWHLLTDFCTCDSFRTWGAGSLAGAWPRSSPIYILPRNCLLICS
jgi:hypothetical protein